MEDQIRREPIDNLMNKLKPIYQLLDGNIKENENKSLLLTLHSRSFSEIEKDSLEYFVKNKKMKGIYVTLNKKANALIDSVKEDKIEIKDLVLIDATDTKPKKVAGVNVLSTEPDDLTELNSMIIEEADKFKKEKGFLIFDSISTLLIYNEPKTIEKFLHSTLKNINSKKVTAVFFIIETEENRSIVNTISQFFDKVIEMKSELTG